MRCRICDIPSRKSKSRTDMLCRSCMWVLEIFYSNGANHNVLD